MNYLIYLIKWSLNDFMLKFNIFNIFAEPYTFIVRRRHSDTLVFKECRLVNIFNACFTSKLSLKEELCEVLVLLFCTNIAGINGSTIWFDKNCRNFNFANFDKFRHAINIFFKKIKILGITRSPSSVIYQVFLKYVTGSNKH